MALFKNILVPTDYGDAAARAADLACELGKQLGARVTLLHVWSVPLPAYAENLTLPLEAMQAAASQALETEAARLRERFFEAGSPHPRTLLVHGLPWRTIIEAIQEHEFDLVVMGTHGRRGLERVFLGSVAEKVVRAAPVPVLTVQA